LTLCLRVLIFSVLRRIDCVVLCRLRNPNWCFERRLLALVKERRSLCIRVSNILFMIGSIEIGL
jgi:hypothetical protein